MTTDNLRSGDPKKDFKIEGSKKKDTSNVRQSNRGKFAQEENKFNLENLTYENLNLDFLNFEKVKIKFNNSSQFYFHFQSFIFNKKN